ncbi:hypothetical protein D3C85_1684270 [compost metagenome]
MYTIRGIVPFISNESVTLLYFPVILIGSKPVNFGINLKISGSLSTVNVKANRCSSDSPFTFGFCKSRYFESDFFTAAAKVVSLYFPSTSAFKN